jgi:hypothetical protein
LEIEKKKNFLSAVERKGGDLGEGSSSWASSKEQELLQQLRQLVTCFKDGTTQQLLVSARTHTPYFSAPPPHQNPKPKTDFLNKVRTAQSPSQSFVGAVRCFAVETFSIIPHSSKYPKSSEVPESFSHCS